jgi:hypothetical protein
MATGPTVIAVTTALIPLGQRVIADLVALVDAMVLRASPSAPAASMILATDQVAAVVKMVAGAAVLAELAVSAGVDHHAKPKQYP